MNGLTARWSFRQAPEAGLGKGAAGVAAAQAVRRPLHPLVERVLAARGHTEPGAIGAFLEPRLIHLHDPSLIPDLDRAAARLLDAARSREPIVIYGDYDVDGITATAILYHSLRAIAPEADVRTYVPHRIDEGYGLNPQAIGELASAGARLIVSVDCGVTAVEPALLASERGVDLIITDHHNPPAAIADLPAAYAVVHPRRPDSSYPFGDLSGAGVAYKLAWRLMTLHCASQRVSPHLRELLVELLAFAAVGTIADIVPLAGENRVIARFGLGRIRSSRFVGLQALVNAAGLTEEQIGEMEVGFRLGPRLNAAGRMGHAREAVELFTIASPDRAAQIARNLSRQNDERRQVENDILEQASELAGRMGMTGPDRRAIVLAHEAWHTGVVGIVCSRLVERFHRPAILMQKRDGVCQGSGRSIDGFNLHAALAACSGHLDRFGGHNMAAGIHLVEPKLADFTDAFMSHANGAIDADRLCAHVRIDCEAQADELTPDAVGQLEALGPFGAGNPRVRLLVRSLRLAGAPNPMGAQGKHVSLQLRAQNGNGSKQFRAVAWNWGEHAERLAAGATIDAVLTPRLSTWNGSCSVEPEIADIALR